MSDLIVATYYEIYHFASRLWDFYEAMVLLQLPYMREITTISNAINGCLGIYNVLSLQPQRSYWLYSLVLSVISTFGGGTIVPVLAGIFRTNAAVSMVNVANGVFAASAYYPTPMFGPILLGTLVGCLGQFLPFDKGLSPIKNNTVWPIQAAFFTSSFYHLMINDKTGFLGIGLRAMIGSYSPATVMVIIATIQIVQLFAQYFLHPDANLFTPFHKLGYLIFQVEGSASPSPAPLNPTINDKPGEYVGWNMQVRKRLHFLIEIGRVATVFAALGFHIFVMIVPSHLPTSPIASSLLMSNKVYPKRVFIPEIKQVMPNVGNITTTWPQYHREFQRYGLPLHHSIGVCQFFVGSLHVASSFGSNCKPYMMKFEDISATMSGSTEDFLTLRLSVYEKNVNKLVWDRAVAGITPLYTSPILQIAKKQLSLPISQTAIQLLVTDQGDFVVIVAPKIDASNLYTMANTQSVFVQYIPWFSVDTSNVQDAKHCGTVFSSSSNENAAALVSKAPANNEKDLVSLIDQYTQESSKLSSNSKNNNEKVAKKLNEIEGKIQQILAKEPTDSTLPKRQVVSYVGIEEYQGQVSLYCDPTTSYQMTRFVFDTLPQAIHEAYHGLFQQWTEVMNVLLSRESLLLVANGSGVTTKKTEL